MVLQRPAPLHALWYRSSMVARRLVVWLAVAGLLALAGGAAAQESLKPVLKRASGLAQAKDYQKVIDLLLPLEASRIPDEPTRFKLRAELGRAFFHMGRYEEAYHYFRAALDLQPYQMEIGVYLEAAAWATGRKEMALQLFAAILAGGARDLYLAVTLPGETSFLADPGVWSILARYRLPLRLDLKHGSFGEVTLGDTRSTVLSAFNIPKTAGAKAVVMARAGPKVLWILHFDSEDRLDRILLHLQHILRYSPYDLRSALGLDWRSAPAQALKELGPAASSSTQAGGERILSWAFPGVETTLEFGSVPEPRPPSVPHPAESLLIVDMRRRAAGPPGAPSGGKDQPRPSATPRR